MASAPSLAADVRYRVVNIQVNAPIDLRGSQATAINSHGDVAGAYSVPDDYEAKPFLYSQVTGFLPLNRLNGFAEAINDHRQVAIFGYEPGTESPTGWRYSPEVGYEPLASLGAGHGDVPRGINNFGHVVGRSDTSLKQLAFLYTDESGTVSLGSLPNRNSSAKAINDLGQVTGHSGAYAFLYTKETGMVAIGQGSGAAVNAYGVVAGDANFQAAIFENGMTRLLDPLVGESVANGMNDYKVVVGYIFDSNSAFIWTDAEGMVELNSLVEPGWHIPEVWGINNNGQIAGHANSIAVRLDPIPPRLDIKRDEAGVTISWSPKWPGLVLEATDDLAAPNWQSMPMPGGHVSAITVTLETSQRFFRLNLEGIRGLCCASQE